MTLHLVFSAGGLASCLVRHGASEPVVLLGDGVYSVPQALAAHADLFVMEEDLTARGLTGDGVRCIDYQDLVAMSVAHARVMSWND